MEEPFPRELSGYDPQDSAVLTMRELEKWLNRLVIFADDLEREPSARGANASTTI